jgi:methanogenic corrinoid protein MtbC1
MSRFAALEKAIRTGDPEAGADEAERLAAGGESPQVIFRDAIQPCLVDIGDQFSRLEIFLPEMMEAADVVKAIQHRLQPYLQAGDAVGTGRARIAICTIRGDLHEIGKNIVRAMLEVNGFAVRDLGVDVSPGDLLRAAGEYDADIIAISALMLPSLPYVRDAIDLVRGSEAARARFKIMVGGGPLSEEWAAKAGADAYGDDAVQAVAQAVRLTSA